MEAKRLISVIDSKYFKRLSITFFIAYISFLLYLTLFSSYYGRVTYHRSISIIPLKTIIQYWHSDNLEATIINILGNIAAFIPLGLLLPIITKKFKKTKTVAIIVLFATVLIEFIQFILGVGASDIDDIILNFLGGMIGFLFYKVNHVMIGLIKGIK